MKRDPEKNLIYRFVAAGCLTVALTSSIGCRGLNHWYNEFEGCVSNQMVDYSNRALAEKAWIREKHHFRDRQYRQEFKDGFIQGYINVAAGGDGCTPTLAPPKYWGWAYQTPYGQAAVSAFFQGFPIGAKAAEQDGVGYWNEIPTSGLSNAVQPYGSEVILEESVPIPVPELQTPESVEVLSPSAASLNIESPSDEEVGSLEITSAKIDKTTAGVRPLVPNETGLQLPAFPATAGTPTVSINDDSQNTPSVSPQTATDAGELPFTFE